MAMKFIKPLKGVDSIFLPGTQFCINTFPAKIGKVNLIKVQLSEYVCTSVMELIHLPVLTVAIISIKYH
jgi:hypothetical protein